ncbi:winged helix-turn-helix transcriptional regulator [Candidatus Woesearchaeota archaeon]|nr:winged helix-turn-helix transcriptional regulator [Candidatus Woesearchaeota archaeon]
MRELFRALGDDTRLALVQALLKGEKSVSELIAEVKKAQPTVSLQLKVLQHAKIVNFRKDGKKSYFQISNPSVRKIIELGEKHG